MHRSAASAALALTRPLQRSCAECHASGCLHSAPPTLRKVTCLSAAADAAPLKDTSPIPPASPKLTTPVTSISLTQASTLLPDSHTLPRPTASPYKHASAKALHGSYCLSLTPQLCSKVLNLRAGQIIRYAVVREDEPDKLMPVAQTTLSAMTNNRLHVRSGDGAPNHITAGGWVDEGMRLTRVLWCSKQQLHVFVYSMASEYLTSQDMCYRQACMQLEQVHDVVKALQVPRATKGGAGRSTAYKFELPKAMFYQVLGLQHGDAITWTAVRDDQPNAQPLMQAGAKVSGSTHYLTAAGSRHVGVVGRWVHGEGLRLKQIRWSRQSGALVAVFVYV